MRKTFIGAAVAATLTLAACNPAVPDPIVDAAALVETGSLLQPQVDVIVTETLATLQAADTARSLDGISNRVGGDWVTEVRGAEYAQAEAGVEGALGALPSGAQAAYVSSETEFPRILVAVSETTDEISTPWIGLWVQDSISTPYQLRGWANMTPGAALPGMAGPSVGAEQLALEDETLEPTAKAAVSQYLELLREGEDSDNAALFEEDSYRERLFAARESLSTAADAADGEYIEAYESDFDHTFILQTLDGGALVFAPIDIRSSFTVDGATVSVSEAEEALLDGELDAKVLHRYRDMIVISIPPAGTDTLMAVVAADHNLVAVSG